MLSRCIMRNMYKVFFLLLSFTFSAFSQKRNLETIPKDLSEAIEKLHSLYTDHDKAQIRRLKEDDYWALEYNRLGLHIRNEWGLWQSKGDLYKYFDSLGVSEPDYISSLVLISFYRSLTGNSIDIQSQIEEFNKSNESSIREEQIYYDSIYSIWESIMIMDTVHIKYRLVPKKKKTLVYPMSNSDELDQYEVCVMKAIVTRKFLEKLLDRPSLELQILDMCSFEKLWFWYPFNKTIIGDNIEYSLYDQGLIR